MQPINLRQEKGTQAPSQKGEGSTYFIPADDLPDGLKSGETIKLIIEGVINIDEQGGTIKVDSVSVENKPQRTDPLQDNIEKGLHIEMSIKK